MTPQGTPRHGIRLGALALFIGMPLLFSTLTLSNVVRWMEVRSNEQDLTKRLAQTESRVRVRAADSRTAPEGDTAALFLAARGSTLARAELQQRLADLVERTGGRLIEVRGDEEPEAAASLSIPLRLSLDIGNDGLFELLIAIETGLPLLTVETLNVRPAPKRSTGPDPDPVLRIALVVRGYYSEAVP